MIKRELGQRIAMLRRKRKLSQERLAELSDYSVDFIGLIERGLNAPSLEGCERIAQALNLPLKELFDFGEPLIPATKDHEPSRVHRKRKKRGG